jgi:uncharacterized coiled-coil DUF342 family protein
MENWTMKTKHGFHRWAMLVGTVMLIACIGCNQKEADETLEKAQDTAGETADTVAKEGEEAIAKGKELVEKGKEMASELGTKTAAFFATMKDQLGDLESFKDTPDKLKTAVSDLIQTIDEKSEELNLPEAINKTLATVKEKLVALKEYLEGEAEQAQIDEKVQEIMNSVKSMLGSASQ